MLIRADRNPSRWRETARQLLAHNARPDSIDWLDPDDPQGVLASELVASHSIGAPSSASTTAGTLEEYFTEAGGGPASQTNGVAALAESVAATVPKSFLDAARLALCHTDPSRWDLLYRILFRLTRGRERHLMADPADPDVQRLTLLGKAVRRDAHKMKAFVRFRRTGAPGEERYIAWHRPEFHIVELVAPFFARRFAVMKWSILTPVGVAHWDGAHLTFGPAATRRDAPTDDGLEDLWKTYYANIFNPARVNVRAMQREMPVKYWQNLPEAQLIDQLLRTGPTRSNAMIDAAPTRARSAAQFLPVEPKASLTVLREAAKACRGCELCEHATQTVFGAGAENARLVLVGEQPGDQEDLAGHPFVGPAGQVLDRALAEAAIARESIYVTNAVKHFKWTPDPRGKRRLHQRPGIHEINACRPWLQQEIGVIRPRGIVLLGATAAQSLMGPAFRITKDRGRIIDTSQYAPIIVATWHPSAILRAMDQTIADAQFQELVSDLLLAAQAVTG